MNRILLSIVLLLVSNVACAFSYTLEITEQELQEKITAIMPIKKKKLFVTLVLSSPQVTLSKNSNTIAIFAEVDATMPGGIKGSGRTQISGALRYNPTKAAFFIDNPVINNLEVDNVPEKFTAKVKQLAQVAITKSMSVYPIYKFKDKNLKHKLAKATLESIEVKDQVLHVTLSAF